MAAGAVQVKTMDPWLAELIPDDPVHREERRFVIEDAPDAAFFLEILPRPGPAGRAVRSHPFRGGLRRERPALAIIDE